MLQKKVEKKSGLAVMNYKKLGRIPASLLHRLQAEARLQVKPISLIQIAFLSNDTVQELYQELFPKEFQTEGIELQHSKIFITLPGGSHVIHKDGIDKKCALNIAIDCNDSDWVRWYDRDALLEAGGKEDLYKGEYTNGRTAYSRNIYLENYREAEFIEEAKHTPGDVYLVNTDVYHSYCNNGTVPRIVLQTKFSVNPSIDDVYQRIQEVGLLNLE